MSKKNKRAKQAKKKPNAEVQSDTEAEEIVSELEEMVSPLPPKKSGAQRVEERAEEIKDAAARPTAVYGPEGEWLIEQIGVLPDVVVDNLPHATFEGSDA